MWNKVVYTCFKHSELNAVVDIEHQKHGFFNLEY